MKVEFLPFSDLHTGCYPVIPCLLSVCFVVGHTSFYAKMVLAKFGVCFKIRTPGSESTKGGLNGNIVGVDLERKSQRAQTILPSQVGTGGNVCV